MVIKIVAEIDILQTQTVLTCITFQQTILYLLKKLIILWYKLSRIICFYF